MSRSKSNQAEVNNGWTALSAKLLTLSFTVGEDTYVQYGQKSHVCSVLPKWTVSEITRLCADVAKLGLIEKKNQVWGAERSLVE